MFMLVFTIIDKQAGSGRHYCVPLVYKIHGVGKNRQEGARETLQVMMFVLQILHIPDFSEWQLMRRQCVLKRVQLAR